jgi:hypothetical protein
MRSFSTLLVTLLWLLWVSPVLAAVDGVVFDSASQEPLTDVAIAVEASGTSKTLPIVTESDGHFSFDPQALFTSSQLDTYSLVLKFKRADYRDIVRVFRSNVRGQFQFNNLRVTMERIAGTTAIPPEVHDPLQQHRSVTGTTLFVVPYVFKEGGADSINSTLMFNIKRGINSHLTSMNLPSISIARFPVSVDTFNTEQVRAYGTELNALAIVSGFGSVASSDQDSSVNVASEYVIIPSAISYTPNTLYVDDQFSRVDLQSTRLFERLQKLWGQNTVLAMSLLEARRAKLTGDKAGLQRALDYVQAEKRLAGPESAELVHEMDAFITALKKELQ